MESLEGCYGYSVNKLEKYPNLAIEKLRIYYQQRGDTIVDFPSLEQCDVVYASSIFDFTKKLTVPYNTITGGTGYEIKKKLPPEIDSIRIHNNYGFTTRGCIRHCPFCVVPEKEGYIYAEGDLFDVWDRKSRNVILLDNNILAMPDHFENICKQSIDNKLKLDFNQGIDFRLVTPEIAELLGKISHAEYHLAFDMPEYADGVLNAIRLLRKYGRINRSIWYVLCGYNTTIEQDLFRLNLLRDNGQQAFVQRYRNGKPDKSLIPLARWANQHNVFYKMTYQQFLSLPENRGYCL
jgi:hypothetical protein